MLLLMRGHPSIVIILSFEPRLHDLSIIIIEGPKLAMGRFVHLVVDSAVTLGRGNRLRLMITLFLQLLFQ